MRCTATNATGKPCGNYSVRGSRPPLCFHHFALGDPWMDGLRRAARSKGARVVHAARVAREVEAVLTKAGWPEGLRQYATRALARGLVGEDVEAIAE